MFWLFAKLSIAQLIRFIVVKLVYLSLNPKLSIDVALFMANYLSAAGDVTFSSTVGFSDDFVNFKTSR